ncbi:hypothetical protein EBR03_09375 [bacterium]|nr:hypothetical protein [bacterium]
MNPDLEVIKQIKKRWTTSSIVKSHYPDCHLEHWSCAIQILIEMLRSGSWHPGNIIAEQREEIMRLRSELERRDRSHA